MTTLAVAAGLVLGCAVLVAAHVSWYIARGFARAIDTHRKGRP